MINSRSVWAAQRSGRLQGHTYRYTRPARRSRSTVRPERAKPRRALVFLAAQGERAPLSNDEWVVRWRDNLISAAPRESLPVPRRRPDPVPFCGDEILGFGDVVHGARSLRLALKRPPLGFRPASRDLREPRIQLAVLLVKWCHFVVTDSGGVSRGRTVIRKTCAGHSRPDRAAGSHGAWLGQAGWNRRAAAVRRDAGVPADEPRRKSLRGWFSEPPDRRATSVGDLTKDPRGGRVVR
jgi:hypothetical protein